MATVPSLIIGGAPRVDLMPRAEIDRRERNALLQRWVRILLLVLLVVVVAIGGAGVLNWTTQQRLAAENQRTQTLLTEIASMKDTRAMLDMKAELGMFRTTAMSAEVDWPTAFAKILSAVPEGVQMTGFELSTGAAPLEESVRLVEILLLEEPRIRLEHLDADEPADEIADEATEDCRDRDEHEQLPELEVGLLHLVIGGAGGQFGGEQAGDEEQ